jgi:hypothetical protein
VVVSVLPEDKKIFILLFCLAFYKTRILSLPILFV